MSGMVKEELFQHFLFISDGSQTVSQSWFSWCIVCNVTFNVVSIQTQRQRER